MIDCIESKRPFLRGIHRSPADSPHKLMQSFMFSLLLVWSCFDQTVEFSIIDNSTVCSKSSPGWIIGWFETPSSSCDVTVMCHRTLYHKTLSICANCLLCGVRIVTPMWWCGSLSCRLIHIIDGMFVMIPIAGLGLIPSCPDLTGRPPDVLQHAPVRAIVLEVPQHLSWHHSTWRYHPPGPV